MQLLTKEELRNELNTWKHKCEQLEYELAKASGDFIEADLKVAELTEKVRQLTDLVKAGDSHLQKDLLK